LIQLKIFSLRTSTKSVFFSFVSQNTALLNHDNPLILFSGTFLGYSSLRMAAQTAENVLIVTIESNPESAKIAKRIHEHAGVAHRIQIVINASNKVIPQLSKLFNVDSFDLIFIDHYKNGYLPDLQLLEQEGLIKCGTVIVADNVIVPGAPDYLKYIRNSPNYTTQLHKSKVEYSNYIPDGVEVSVRVR
jgi:catechol O-methyltransferase